MSSSQLFPQVLEFEKTPHTPVTYDESREEQSARIELFDVSSYFITGLLSRNRARTFELSNSVGRVSNSRKFSLTHHAAFRIDLRRMYTYVYIPAFDTPRRSVHARNRARFSTDLFDILNEVKDHQLFRNYLLFYHQLFTPLKTEERYKKEETKIVPFLFFSQKIYIFSCRKI